MSKAKMWADNNYEELTKYGNQKYIDDFKFQLPFYKTVAKILKQKLGVKTVAETDIETDRKTCADFLCTTSDGREIMVACRIRRDCKFRDLSIRYSRTDRGRSIKTEIDKLNEGWGQIYLMIWLDKDDEVADYALIDIGKMREKELFKKDVLRDKYSKYPKQNYDGQTSAMFYSMNMLYELNTIIYSTVKYTGSGVFGKYNEDGW